MLQIIALVKAYKGNKTDFGLNWKNLATGRETKEEGSRAT